MSGYFQGAPVVINTTTVAGIQGANYAPEIEISKPDSDGRAVKTIAVVIKNAPKVDISTLNMAAVLALMSTTGELPYVALTDLKWYGRKADANGPTFASGTSHERGAATAGTLFFSGIEASALEPAVMALVALLTSSDGTTHPVTFTQVTAPTDPLTIAPFYLDSVTIDGTDVAELVSVSISAGASPQIEHGTKPYPRTARVRSVDWSITVRHNDMTVERSKTDKAAAIAVVFKSRSTGGPTIGATTITFTVTGVLFQGGSTRGAGGNAEATHMVNGRHDGTNQPATWSVA